MSTESDGRDTLAKFGTSYQERVTQAILQDYKFAERMIDVVKPEYFELKYLREIVSHYFDYRRKYKTYPSVDLLDTVIKNSIDDELLTSQVREYLVRTAKTNLNGDVGYLEDSSLEFCRKQTMRDAMIQALDLMEDGKIDDIVNIVKDAAVKGASRDLGHNYMEGFAQRGKKSLRKPIPTGWSILDREFNGGWERGIIATFIAPTGAGKSMFLVNCGAAAVEQGLNVVYFTLEMADYKIGLRFDSYYSGVEINKVSDNLEKVENAAREKAKGKLWIKEFPTKTATVNTLRSCLQQLIAVQGFVPDVVLVDYADLLRGSRGYGDKRFELEGNYEDLRSLAQEFNVVLITADQTNRSGLDMEIVTIGQIGESYAKATVCDVIITVSRRPEDKQANTGRIFLAKSRLGPDGKVFPFIMNTATVKVTMLESNIDPIQVFIESGGGLQETAAKRFQKLNKQVVGGQG